MVNGDFPEALKKAITDLGYGPDTHTYELCLAAFQAGRRQGVSDISGHPLGAAGVELIAVERQRQLDVEGFDTSHDDKHSGGELSAAASAYTLLACDIMAGTPYPQAVLERLERAWPWEECWWKPSPDPIRNLIKAGALLAADIDRLHRKERK